YSSSDPDAHLLVAPASLHPSAPHRGLHSFPTRRSSDLTVRAEPGPGGRPGSLTRTGGPWADRVVESHARPGDQSRGGGHGHQAIDRKSTRLNSSHEWISYAVFCLKKKKKKQPKDEDLRT